MDSLVLGVLKIGAILLLMSIGIMMIEASLVLLLISLPFPGLRNFVPDVGAFVDILGWALRGILSYKTKEEDKFRNRDVEDYILHEWSDTTDRPRPGATHMYTEPYKLYGDEPHPQTLEKPKTYHCAPHAKNPYYETDKRVYHQAKHQEKPKPVPEKPKQSPVKPPPPPSRKPNEFVDAYNKIKTFDVTDQMGDSD